MGGGCLPGSGCYSWDDMVHVIAHSWLVTSSNPNKNNHIISIRYTTIITQNSYTTPRYKPLAIARTILSIQRNGDQIRVARAASFFCSRFEIEDISSSKVSMMATCFVCWWCQCWRMVTKHQTFILQHEFRGENNSGEVL